MRSFLAGCGLLLLILLSGCQFEDNSHSRLWLFKTIVGDHGKWDTILTPSTFLELRPDSSYTQDFGKYGFGTWSLRDQRLYLTDQHHTTYVYQSQKTTGNKLRIILGRNTFAEFDGLSLPSGSLEKDPFSRANNQWRLPAVHKESIEELRRRLYDHCHFWEVYFSWVVDENVETADVRNMPTPLKIYDNGFGLKKYSNLPAEWKSYFFDGEDCHKADSLIKRTFRRNNINWPNSDNEYKKFISGFQQLQQFLHH